MSAPTAANDRKVYVVTGANRGIGLEIVRAILRHGLQKSQPTRQYSIYLACRSETLANAAIDNLSEEFSAIFKDANKNFRLHFLEVDLLESSVDHLQQQVTKIAEQDGRIDCLVNNAGFAYKGSRFGAAEARKTVDINFYGTKRVTDAFLPLLDQAAAQEHGEEVRRPRVVNVASTLGSLHFFDERNPAQLALKQRFLDARNDADGGEAAMIALMEEFVAAVSDGNWKEKGWRDSMYGVSKAGMIGLSNAYAARQSCAESGPKVLVTSMCPGSCQTDMSGGRGLDPPSSGAKSVLFLTDELTDAAFLDGGFHGGFSRDKAVRDWAGEGLMLKVAFGVVVNVIRRRLGLF